MWVYQVTAMETLSLSWAIVLPTEWFATFSQEKPIFGELPSRGFLAFMAETTPHV